MSPERRSLTPASLRVSSWFHAIRYRYLFHPAVSASSHPHIHLRRTVLVASFSAATSSPLLLASAPLPSSILRFALCWSCSIQLSSSQKVMAQLIIISLTLSRLDNCNSVLENLPGFNHSTTSANQRDRKKAGIALNDTPSQS